MIFGVLIILFVFYLFFICFLFVFYLFNSVIIKKLVDFRRKKKTGSKVGLTTQKSNVQGKTKKIFLGEYY